MGHVGPWGRILPFKILFSFQLDLKPYDTTPRYAKIYPGEEHSVIYYRYEEIIKAMLEPWE